LLDAINDGCYAEMVKMLKTKEEVFIKELANQKKKEA